MRRLWQRLGVEGVLALVLVAVVVILATMPGCCASVSDRRAAAREALDAWAILERGAVPAPGHSPEAEAAFARAKARLGEALRRLGEAEGAAAREEEVPDGR